VGQVQEARRGWDSDRGFCLAPPPRHGRVDAGSDKKHAFVTTMIICRQHDVERSCISHVGSSANHIVGVRTGPHGSLFAALTHTGTPGNAAVGRLVNAAVPGCSCLALG
jgi:hypothetical protein